MTPRELADCLAAIGWSARQLADVLGISEATIRKSWLSGKRPIGAPVAAWLRGLAAAHRRLPPPAIERAESGRPVGGRLFARADRPR